MELDEEMGALASKFYGLRPRGCGSDSDGFDENYFSTEDGGDEYDEGASFDDGSRPVKGSGTRRGRCRAESVRVSLTQPRLMGRAWRLPRGVSPPGGEQRPRMCTAGAAPLAQLRRQPCAETAWWRGRLDFI